MGTEETCWSETFAGTAAFKGTRPQSIFAHRGTADFTLNGSFCLVGKLFITVFYCERISRNCWRVEHKLNGGKWRVILSVGPNVLSYCRTGHLNPCAQEHDSLGVESYPRLTPTPVLPLRCGGCGAAVIPSH